MREIKFRAWDKRDNLMKWISGVFSQGYATFAEDNYGRDRGVFTGLTPQLILMQSTGRLDRNKKLIYEGDLLQVTYDDDGHTDIIKVYWSKSAGALIVEDDFGEGDMLPIGWALDYWNNSGNTVEVIGNIYENPELLK